MTTPRTALAYYLTYNFPPTEITHRIVSSVQHYLVLLNITLRACCARHSTHTNTKPCILPTLHKSYIPPTLTILKLALLASYQSHPTILPLYWYYTYVTLLCFHNHFSYLAIHLYSYFSCLNIVWEAHPLNHFVQVILSLITPIINCITQLKRVLARVKHVRLVGVALMFTSTCRKLNF